MPSISSISIGLIIAALLVIGVEAWRIHSLDSDVAALQSQNDQLTNDNKAFSLSVQRQNADIAKWKSEADVAAKSAKDAIAKAETQAQAYKKNALSIQAYKPTGNQCKDVAAIVKRYYSGAKP